MTKITDIGELLNEMNPESQENRNYTHIEVYIEDPNLPKYEIIRNPKANWKKKAEYYAKAYNDDCTLKTYNPIRIAGFTKTMI